MQAGVTGDKEALKELFKIIQPTSRLTRIIFFRPEVEWVFLEGSRTRLPLFTEYSKLF